MGDIKLVCANCRRVYNSGVFLGEGATATLHINQSQCPFCGRFNKMPEGTFRGTVSGFVEILQASKDPEAQLKEMLAELEAIKSGNKPAKASRKLRAWLPSNIRDAAAWMTIIIELLRLLHQEPSTKITEPIVVQVIQQVQVVNLIDQRHSP